MKISRHIHHLDNPDSCARYEFNFDPPYEFKSTLGKIDEFYPGVDFSKAGYSLRLDKVPSIINDNGLLHIRELMNAGDILSVAVRKDYALEKLVYDQCHALLPMSSGGYFTYLFIIGLTGAFQITGNHVKDIHGYLQLLSSNLTDPAIRDYVLQNSVLNPVTKLSWTELFPDVMTLEEAALFLRKSESWVSHKVGEKEIRRTRNNRFLKKDLLKYLEED